MTNLLDTLLEKIEDQALRDELATQIAQLRSTKDFGLVFERHIPERVRLYGHTVRRGSKVQERASRSNDTWLVRRITGPAATLVDNDGAASTKAVDELVVVSDFRDSIYPGLTEVGKVYRGGDKPAHVVINGENFHALEALIYVCEGEVDAIYIDPPYNSGARDWKYNNNYVDGDDRHSKWLSFMEKRLQLAKRLLNPEESILIVAIDEKEYLRLGLLLEQLFPEATIQMVTTVVKPEGTGRKLDEFSRTNEFLFFVMVGTVTIAAQRDNMFDRDGINEEPVGVEWRNLRRREKTSKRGSRKNQFYAVFVDKKTGRIRAVGDALADGIPRNSVKVPKGTRAVFPLSPAGVEMIWGVVPERLRELAAAGYARSNGNTIQFLNAGTVAGIQSGEIVITGHDSQAAVIAEYADGSKRLMPKTVWVRESHNAQASGTLLVKKFIPGRDFPFPKSLYAIEDALRFFVQDKPDALILDFFGGSGTTTHAVARLNRQDGGHRRAILITNNEISEEEAAQLTANGVSPGDPQWEALGIFEYITKPRITAAFTGETPEGTPVAGYYKYTDVFPIATGFEENVEFFSLTYLDPSTVSRGKSFAAIAPLLWLRSGAAGPRIETVTNPFAMPAGSRYAILFDIAKWRSFVDVVTSNGTLTHAYVVTDSLAQFQEVASELPSHLDVSMLYESYLHNFELRPGIVR